MRKRLEECSTTKAGNGWKRDTRSINQRKEERGRTIETAIWLARHRVLQWKSLRLGVSKNTGADNQAFFEAHRVNIGHQAHVE
jgi:hypothetical protein